MGPSLWHKTELREKNAGKSNSSKRIWKTEQEEDGMEVANGSGKIVLHKKQWRISNFHLWQASYRERKEEEETSGNREKRVSANKRVWEEEEEEEGGQFHFHRAEGRRRMETDRGERNPFLFSSSFSPRTTYSLGGGLRLFCRGCVRSASAPPSAPAPRRSWRPRPRPVLEAAPPRPGPGARLKPRWRARLRN